MSDQTLREALEELVASREDTKSDHPNDYVIAPYELRELLNLHRPDDDEKFCPKCFAGMDAANHNECVDLRPAAAQVEITDEAAEVVASKLFRLSFGSTEAGWDHPEHESIRKRYRESARDLIAAALPYLVPRPLLDREAVRKAACEALAEDLVGTLALVKLQMSAGPKIADAVVALARPLPSVEQFAEVLRAWKVVPPTPQMPVVPDARNHYRTRLATALHNLITGDQS